MAIAKRSMSAMGSVEQLKLMWLVPRNEAGLTKDDLGDSRFEYERIYKMRNWATYQQKVSFSEVERRGRCLASGGWDETVEENLMYLKASTELMSNGNVDDQRGSSKMQRMKRECEEADDKL
nr:hypothetical protein CFP56_12033 [Quercus suber]